MKKTIESLCVICVLFLSLAAVPGADTNTAKPEESEKDKAAAVKPPKPGDDFMDPRFNEARLNIKWAVADNAGAKANYCSYRGSIGKPGVSRAKIAAVLQAQKHNRHAQDTIKEYGEVRTDRYIESLGAAANCN